MSIENGCDYYYSCNDCARADCLVNKQKAEIERLTEERDKYQEKWHTAYMNELNLRKQVDELKEQRDVFKRLFESANTSNFSTNSIIETMNSFYREQAQHLAELKIEQAVKDKAKEIYYHIAKAWYDKEMLKIFREYLKERFGVEVE